MKKAITFFSLLFLVACTANRVLVPTAADAERGAQKFPGMTLADLTEGKTIYEANCGLCHELEKPRSRNEAGWNAIVPGMVAKVNKKAGSEVIDSRKKDLVLHYLITMSNAPKRK